MGENGRVVHTNERLTGVLSELGTWSEWFLVLLIFLPHQWPLSSCSERNFLLDFKASFPLTSTRLNIFAQTRQRWLSCSNSLCFLSLVDQLPISQLLCPLGCLSRSVHTATKDTYHELGLRTLWVLPALMRESRGFITAWRWLTHA